MPRIFAVQLKDEPAERYEQWVNTPVYTHDYEDCIGWLGCELPKDGHSCEFAELAGDGAVTCASSSKVNRLRSENAKLRLENAKLRDAMYTNAGKHALQHMDEDELRIWATQQVELIDELRELVRIMAYCMHDGRECDHCAMNGADMSGEVDQLLACDELYRRIVEVVD